MLRYAITNRLRLGGSGPECEAALLGQAAHLASMGIDFLQLREPDLPAATVAHLARTMLGIFRSHGDRTKLLIHSRPDIAIATGAGGVHLPSRPGSLSPRQVRALYASAQLPMPTISVSCHTLDEVARTASPDPDEAATLILFGPVFEKVIGTTRNETRISAGTGLDRLRAACEVAASTPVFALGGITRGSTSACLAAGAAGIAAIRLFASDQP